MQTINIVNLIEKNSITRLSKDYENRLINKIKLNFTENQQQIFVASFYTFLNYDSKKDFVIDFDSVWKWLGFTRKDNAKRLLEKYLIIDIDYKIEELAPPNGGASFAPTHGGYNKETILLTVNTFKKLCLKAGTKKADEIHDYYIKLEELLHETINEETDELRTQLVKTKDRFEKDLEFKEFILDKIKKENKQLQSKLEIRERAKYQHTNSVYIISNPLIKNYFKLGKSSNLNSRVSNYQAGSPLDYKVEYSRPLCSKMEETALENLLLIIFDNFRVINEINHKREWVENISLETLKTEMDLLVDFLEERKKVYDPKYVSYKVKIENNIDVEIENDIDVETENNIDVETENNIDVEIENGEDNIEVETENIEYDVDVETKNIETENINYDDEDKTKIEERVYVDPKNFDKFIEECFEKDTSYFLTGTDLRGKFRIWSNSNDVNIKKDLEIYMKVNYKSSHKFVDNVRKNGYFGLKLKEEKFECSPNNYDYEVFVKERCKIHCNYRIGYTDFYKYFTDYKKETDPNYKLTRKYQEVLRKFITDAFTTGRCLVGDKKNSEKIGIYGLGHPDNNCGLKAIKIRRNKPVLVYDEKTNQLVNTFDCLSLASETLNIPFSSLQFCVTSNKSRNGLYFKYKT